MNSICDMLGIKYPIFQGGMAWVANHAIAAAVSEAGGLGIIAAGNAPADWLREEIRACKKITNKPFGVNVMLLSPYADEVAKVVAEEGVKVVTTGAGNPGKYMDLWKEKGMKVIPVVPSVAIAKRMEKGGADAVIAEGGESGGHIGELTTMVLVPQVVDAVSIPVIAAGGIADGRGFAAAMMLGAEAVQIGTRFLVAEECKIHEAYKERVLKATDIDTVVTGRSTGHPVRGLRNQLTRSYLQMEKDGADLNKLEQLGAGALYKAVVEGNVINGAVMAGQIAGLITKRQTAQEIVDELMLDLKEVMEARVRQINEELYK
ncbi:MAG: fabK [Clostridia bacterium]|nr:fabK [Clostridia bacterium]